MKYFRLWDGDPEPLENVNWEPQMLDLGGAAGLGWGKLMTGLQKTSFTQ